MLLKADLGKRGQGGREGVEKLVVLDAVQSELSLKTRLLRRYKTSEMFLLCGIYTRAKGPVFRIIGNIPNQEFYI